MRLRSDLWSRAIPRSPMVTSTRKESVTAARPAAEAQRAAQPSLPGSEIEDSAAAANSPLRREANRQVTLAQCLYGTPDHGGI